MVSDYRAQRLSRRGALRPARVGFRSMGDAADPRQGSRNLGRSDPGAAAAADPRQGSRNLGRSDPAAAAAAAAPAAADGCGWLSQLSQAAAKSKAYQRTPQGHTSRRRPPLQDMNGVNGVNGVDCIHAEWNG